MTFLEYVKTGVEHRHMKDVVPDPSSHSQSPGKTVPDYVRTKKTNSKLEAIKNMEVGRSIFLSPLDVKEIEGLFPTKADLHTSYFSSNFKPEIKEIGKPSEKDGSKIILSFDPLVKKYKLTKVRGVKNV